MKATQAEKQEIIKGLKEMIKPGDVVYTILRHRSASGMSRVIDLYVMGRDNYGRPSPQRISWQAAKLLGYTYDMDREGLKVGGAGMDMGFHVVYSLSATLFPKGFKVGRKGTHSRNGDTSGFDNDGGYALNQEWM